MELKIKKTVENAEMPGYVNGIFEITGFRKSEPRHYRYDEDTPSCFYYYTGIEIEIPEKYYFTIEGNGDENILKTFMTENGEIIIKSKYDGDKEFAVLVPHQIVDVKFIKN